MAKEPQLPIGSSADGDLLAQWPSGIGYNNKALRYHLAAVTGTIHGFADCCKNGGHKQFVQHKQATAGHTQTPMQTGHGTSFCNGGCAREYVSKQEGL